MAKTDVYKEVKVLEFPRGTVKVYIPDLSEEERARRYAQIYKAAAALLEAKI